MELFYQIIGWVGAGLVILAYVLVSNKKVAGTSKWYQYMNLVGCIGVGINAFHQAAWPSLGIQIVWGVVALVALLRIKQ